MNLTEPVTDNVSELLFKIIEFTKVRNKVLTANLKNTKTKGYVPRDLAVEEFAEAMDVAIAEHIQNERIIFCDSDNIKYGPEGRFEAEVVADLYAKELLETNSDEYMEFQINKLSENAINKKLALELLREKDLFALKLSTDSVNSEE